MIEFYACVPMNSYVITHSIPRALALQAPDLVKALRVLLKDRSEISALLRTAEAALPLLEGSSTVAVRRSLYAIRIINVRIGQSGLRSGARRWRITECCAELRGDQRQG